MINKRQMSESLFVYLILALSGGGMDAYSYICRDGVFANAQTGNMLLFGVRLAERDFGSALRYLWPILAFTAGIIIADVICYNVKSQKIHWRQLSLVIEIVVLFFVAFIPQTMNPLANVLISFACGLQVESFRSVNGNTIATTMCIGNLRSGTYHLDKFIQTRNKEHIKKTALYYSVILFFVIGAIIESCLISVFAEKAIVLSVVLLFCACILMLHKE